MSKYTQHRDSEYNKSGTSEDKESLFGDKYTQHRDSEYSKSGTSEDKESLFGSKYTQHYDSDGNKSGTSEDKDGCFISSACSLSLGLQDDCYELTILRSFRDEHLKKTIHGRESVNLYYEIAPKIVNSININKKSKEIYRSIYDKLIIPCINYIELGDYEKAQKHYMNIVNKLSRDYL